MTITLTREEAQQVLGVLTYHYKGRPEDYEVIYNLRARLAQPESEPVQKTAVWNIKYPDYTAPPQREWQGLTFEDAMHIAFEFGEMETHKEQYKFARAIEAKLKEKNT
jgi:hypothetical protein